MTFRNELINLFKTHKWIYYDRIPNCLFSEMFERVFTDVNELVKEGVLQFDNKDRKGFKVSLKNPSSFQDLGRHGQALDFVDIIANAGPEVR